MTNWQHCCDKMKPDGVKHIRLKILQSKIKKTMNRYP